ncbi:hypothetical protein Metho_0685 [Methanomethylovorans hollandica DSM 15978]|uniref:DUF8136 domain-containing protein n=1 Tax=Methanomethylovorans hollandica (strain DSM 15978 / NBRC 107637 / DMS1) TaxID=867904 RepID=L0KW72_METHD|nr:hypothetical protein [Methanomethylovorans hollandica]AGB48940.1 hypothetical protein Metho_0685 [Methanomethylovorans hollandica DSM 15978]
MNDNENNNEESVLPSEPLDRNHLLDISSKMIKDIFNRTKGKRFRPTEGDAVKLQYLRILISAIQAHNAILKDSELDDIKKRLDSLEATKTPRE